jgi:iron complex outermembrane receptor protein
MLGWAGLVGLLAVSAGAQDSRSGVLSLGEVLVVGVEGEPEAGATARVSGREAQLRRRSSVGAAAALAPGTTPTRVGARNETMTAVRGFDTRQVPLFLDGIPIYVPYDGNVDMGRLDMFGVAELTISKGYSPVTLGANALGGAINVMTHRPEQPEELELRLGTGSGRAYEAAARAGLLRDTFYALAGVSWREQDYVRLSDDFRPTPTQAGRKRENSDRRDVQLFAKLGWMPGGGEDELAVGFVRQESEKGVPPYAGTDPEIMARYWCYDDWSKNSLYALGNVGLGPEGYLKPRLYVDTYENTLKAFDDNRYRTQEKRSSWTSIYDDYSWGGSVEGGGALGERQRWRMAAHYKQDVHREHNVGSPRTVCKDETWALGVEDRLALSEWLTLAGGLGVEGRRSLKAEDAETGERFERNHNVAVNPQAGLFAEVGEGTVRATVARKSRFPTLKDRYSYRLGTALANPELDPEHAWHLETGYEGRLVERLDGRASVFYSRIQDAIERENDVARSEDGAWLYQLRNIGKVEQAGAELGLTWRPVEDLAAGVDYLYMHRRNRGRPDLKPTDVPAHSVKLHVEWMAHQRLTLAPAVEFGSSRYGQSGGGKVDHYWLGHLDARLDLPGGVELLAGVHNVLDKNYELDAGYPEEGRSFYVGCQFTF